MKKVASLAAVLCLSSVPVLAGGLSEAVVEAPVGVVVPVPVSGNSFGTTEYAAAGAAVLLLLALSSSSSTTTTTTTN